MSAELVIGTQEVELSNVVRDTTTAIRAQDFRFTSIHAEDEIGIGEAIAMTDATLDKKDAVVATSPWLVECFGGRIIGSALFR